MFSHSIQMWCVEGLLEIGYLCSIELFQIRFNYSLFSECVSLSLSSSCRSNGGQIAESEFSLMLMMCNLRVLKFDFSSKTPHTRERARVNFQFNSEMKNRQWWSEGRESDLKMKLLNCVSRVAEMLLIINFSIWTHIYIKLQRDMPCSRIFQFSYF